MAKQRTDGQHYVANDVLQASLEVWCAACRQARAASPDPRKFERAVPAAALLAMVGSVVDNLLLKASYSRYPASVKEEMRQQAMFDFFRWGHNFSSTKTVHSKNPAFTYITNNAERSIQTYLAKVHYKWRNTMEALGNEEVRSHGQSRIDAMLVLMADHAEDHDTTREDVLDIFREAQCIGAREEIGYTSEDDIQQP
jgi:hypothetical protein